MKVSRFKVVMLLVVFAFAWAFSAHIFGIVAEVPEFAELSKQGVQIGFFYALFIVGLFSFKLNLNPISDVQNRWLWLLLGRACDAEGCSRKAVLTYIPTGENLCGYHAGRRIK